MSWTPGVGVGTSIGLGVGYQETVELSPSRNRAVELAASVLDQAVAAELAGQPERSAELRSAADKLRAAVDAVDAAVSAVDWAYREVG